MATEVNSKSIWEDIWNREGLDTWRRYPGPFGRITWLLENATKETQPGVASTVVDVGCGVGQLLADVHIACPDVKLVGVDLAGAAAKHANARGIGIQTIVTDLELEPGLPHGDVMLCTEVLEHLTLPAVTHVLEHSRSFKKALFMVPNYCLGPEVESQHLRKWSAKEFLDLLRLYHPTARVEVFFDKPGFDRTGHRGYLLGVCGYPKEATLSFTMPVKNEEQDIERVLASFRGAADEIVIGIDDKSTDATEEIAKLYADKVFHFTWKQDFSAARNACIDQCTGDWIFMSEGHEHLKTGQQELIQIGEAPPWVSVIEVRRESRGSEWYFPWLFRNGKGIRFKNAVHNTLVGYDQKDTALSEAISTWHERSIEKAVERRTQRSGMNKQELLRRVREEGSLRDMYYLGVEYRDILCLTCGGTRRVVDAEASNGTPQYAPCPDCVMYSPRNKPIPTGVRPFGWRQSLYWFENFIKAAKPCGMRYQARLSLARMYWKLEMYPDAKRVLAPAVADDPTRIEHWTMLGEICEEQGQLDLAMRFFEYASLGIGRPPSSFMFLDKAHYTYMPAQRLCSIYAQVGRWEDALAWAQKVPSLLPEWAPPAALEEAQAHIELIESKITGTQEESCKPIAQECVGTSA